jgi:tRNA A-37 threonylcarbamoyl transferase component Bud32
MAVFCAPAGAQSAPRTDAADLATLAGEIRRAPSDARSVHARFGALTRALQERGRKPTAEQGLKLRHIRRLLGKGRLSPAAEGLDEVVAELAREPRASGLTPQLLSGTWVPAAAPAASEIAAATRDATPLPKGMRAPPPPPESPGPSWLLLAASLGGVLLVGSSWLLLGRAGRPAPPAPAAARSQTSPGTLSDKYAIGKSIASGGMGEIYEGRDLKLGRRVAIKRMLPDVKLDAELRAQFFKEARTVAKLSHPYIVQIHEALESGDELYLVFEFVDGETVARRLTREARLPLKECRRVFGYVCEAIEYAHKNHVLHRDIKPANIMIDPNGIARVMDFGIALESTRTLAGSSSAVLDASGTLRYMPPEQHHGRSVRASDVYAMGVCLYEMATGHPPFTAASVEALLEQKRGRRFPAASTLAPGLGKDFDVLMAAALSPDPGSRVSTPLELLELLDGVLSKA